MCDADMSRLASRKTRKSAYRKTLDEFMRELLSQLIPALQRLPYGYYKRDYKGAVAEYGHLLDVGDYQMLMMYLQWASKPRRRGPPELSAFVKLRQWEEYHHEFGLVKQEIVAETGKEPWLYASRHRQTCAQVGRQQRRCTQTYLTENIFLTSVKENR